MFLLEPIYPSYFALIDTEGDSLKLTVINSTTAKTIPSLTFIIDSKYKSIKEFIANFSSIFPPNSLKAVVLQVFGYENSEFFCNAEFCNYLTIALTDAKIPFYFISIYNWVLSTLFITANITVAINERVVILFTHEKYVDVASYKFMEDGYAKIHYRRLYMDYEMEFDQKDFEAFNRPAKIIATTTDCYPIPIGILAKMGLDGFVFVNPLALLERNVPTAEICKWILDRANNRKYHVIPTSIRKVVIATTINETICPLITAPLYTKLPFKKVIHSARSVFEDFLSYKDAGSDDEVILGKVNLPKKCHRNKVTLSVDINNFPTFDVTNLIFQQILTLPQTLNETVKSKIPIIGFCDNVSIICVYKDDENKYEFLQGWNGLYGEEMYISFYDHDQPRFCQEAAEDYQLKPACVVCEVLRIIAMSPTNITKEHYWEFKILKNAKNKIIVKVGDKNGKFSDYKPSTLMAMLLKEHLKAIKDEIGTEPSELGFWFLDDYSSDEKCRVKNGITDACKSLKVKPSFI